MKNITDNKQEMQFDNYKEEGSFLLSPEAVREMMGAIGRNKEEMYKIGAILEVMNSLMSSPLFLEGMIDDCTLSISRFKEDNFSLRLINSEGTVMWMVFPYSLDSDCELKVFNPAPYQTTEQRIEGESWLVLESKTPNN